MIGADHVVVNTTTNAFECRRCGASYTPALPCSLTMYLGMSRTFLREHRRCIAPPDTAESYEDLARYYSQSDYSSARQALLPVFLRKQAD